MNSLWNFAQSRIRSSSRGTANSRSSGSGGHHNDASWEASPQSRRHQRAPQSSNHRHNNNRRNHHQRQRRRRRNSLGLGSFVDIVHNVSESIERGGNSVLDGIDSFMNSYLGGRQDHGRRRHSHSHHHHQHNHQQQQQHRAQNQNSNPPPYSNASSSQRQSMSTDTAKMNRLLAQAAFSERVHTYRFTKHRKKYLKSTSLQDEDPECVICADEYSRNDFISNLPCGHNFHLECIAQWAEHQLKQSDTLFVTCPNCRYELSRRCTEDINCANQQHKEGGKTYQPTSDQDSRYSLQNMSADDKQLEYSRLCRMEQLFSEEGIKLVHLTSALDNLSGEVIQFVSTCASKFDMSADELRKETERYSCLLEKIMFALDEMVTQRDSIRKKRKENIKKIQHLLSELKEAKDSIF